jgi:hypothetical protein
MCDNCKCNESKKVDFPGPNVAAEFKEYLLDRAVIDMCMPDGELEIFSKVCDGYIAAIIEVASKSDHINGEPK